MKLNTTPTNPVEMSGVCSTKQFTIQATAKSFQILSDGLYSNKIRAIIRELSTNAYDSHVAAGKAQVPFTVNIPNVLAPWFSVRDYGVGLSHKEVLSIYTSYFTSTKSDSDDFVGALGLGSKSPFSYTDNFSITAIKDKRKGLYSAYIDDTGVPSIALMSESETDEPNGVEVRVAVNDRSDFRQWAQEAASVYTYFSVRPEITGADVEIKSVTYIARDVVPGVHIQKRTGTNVVVMGNIAYPVCIKDSMCEFTEHQRNIFKCLLNQGIEFNLPIGAVEMSASREELSYTKKTIASLAQIYELTYDNIQHQLFTEADSISNKWEQASFLANRADRPLFRSAAVSYQKQKPNPLIAENGRNGLQFAPIPVFTEQLDLLNARLHIFRKKRFSDSVSGPQSAKIDQFTDSQGNVCKKAFYEILSCMDSVKFVLGSPRGSVTRVKNWMRKGSFNKRVVLVTPIDAKKPVDWQGFLGLIHNPPQSTITDLNTLPELPKRNRSESTPVYEFISERVYRSNLNFKTVMRPVGTVSDFDQFDGIKAYVYLQGSKTSINGKPIDVRRISELLAETRLIDRKNIRIFGVRSKDISTVETQSDWVPVDQLMEQVLKDYDKTKILSVYLNSVDDKWSRLFNRSSFVNKINSGPLVDLAKIDLDKTGVHINKIKKLFKEFGNKSQIEYFDSVISEAGTTLSRYSLIPYLSVYADFEEVIKYIKLVDSTKGEAS